MRSKVTVVGLCLASALALVACGDKTVDSPNIPSTFNGRSVKVEGTVNVNSKNVTFYVWDSEVIDGDRISLIVNDNTILSDYTLTGSKHAVSYKLDNKGYNYVMLYAHNVGSIPPNTAALSIDDGDQEQVLVLSADLSTNGAYSIYVQP
jgi:hypothetical protein